MTKPETGLLVVDELASGEATRLLRSAVNREMQQASDLPVGKREHHRYPGAP